MNTRLLVTILALGLLAGRPVSGSPAAPAGNGFGAAAPAARPGTGVATPVAAAGAAGEAVFPPGFLPRRGAVVLELRETPAGDAAGRGRMEACSARAAALGAVSMRRLFAGHADPADPLARFWIAKAAPGRDPAEVAAALAGEPWVAGAVPDIVLPLSGCVPDDHFFVHPHPDSAQWALHSNPTGPDLQAVEAWNVTPGDSSVVIAVLDSGVDWHHPEFGLPLSPEGSIWINWAEANGAPGVDDDQNEKVDDLRGWDFVDVSTIPGELGRLAPGEDGLVPDNDPNDYDGHGTFVAGIIGARADDGLGMAGAAPGCRIMPLRVGWREDYILPEDGRRVIAGVVAMSFCAQAIVYAADHGARVINASWLSQELLALKEALDYAINTKGVVVVDAAGNTGGLSDRETQYYNYLSQRGDCIEVAALSRRGGISAVSGIGSWVDVSAPGEGILSLTRSGARLHKVVFAGATSFAAPFVSAAAGLLLSVRPHLTPAGVRQALMSTATPIDGLEGNWQYPGKLGAGMVNLAAAVGVGPLNPAWLEPARTGQPAVSPPAVLRDGGPVFTDAANRLMRFRAVPMDLHARTLADSVRLPLDSPVAGLAAELPPDGDPVYAVAFRSGHVAVLDSAAEAAPGWPRPVGGPLYGGPVLADLDGDGQSEVVVAGSDSLLHAWRRSGALAPGFPVRLGDGAAAAPAVGDLDGDGDLDLVTVTRDGSIEVCDGRGIARPGWPVASAAGAGLASPTLADVDGDGRLEIVIAGAGGRIDCLNADGQGLTAGWPVELGAAPAGEPAAADLDGDDRAEILVALADGRLVVLSGAGAIRPGWPMALPAAPAGGPLAVVIDGGIRPAVVAATRTGCVHAFDATGREPGGWPKRNGADFATGPAAGGFEGTDGVAIWTAAADGEVRAFILAAPSAGAVAAPWSCEGGNPARTRALPATVRPAIRVRQVAVSRLRLAPNPSLGGAVQAWLTVPRAGEVSVEVFDVQGRLVRRLFAGSLPEGETPLAWDGLDERGRPVAAGLYGLRAATPGAIVTGRLVRLR